MLDGVRLSGYTYPVAYMMFNLEYQKLLEEFEVMVSVNGIGRPMHASDIDLAANTLEQLQNIWMAQTEG
jgi:hypothetical protein